MNISTVLVLYRLMSHHISVRHILIQPRPYLVTFFALLVNITSLVQSGENTRVSMLINQVQNGKGSIRYTAASTLLELSRDDVVSGIPELARALHHKDEFVRRIATTALGNVGHDSYSSVFPLLKRTLSDPDFRVRSSAAYAVGRLMQGGPPRRDAIDALKLALEDVDVLVRFSTVDALRIVGPPAFEAVDALARLIEDRELLVRLAAIRALTEIARGSSPSEFVVTVMTRALKSTDALVRSSTAEALGRLGLSSPAIINALDAATKDPDELVSGAALMAFGELVQRGVSEGIPVLTAAIASSQSHKRRAAAQALSRLGPKAKSAAHTLEKALGDSEPDVRRDAARALRNMGADILIPLDSLGRRVRDENASVREAAISALGQRGAAAKQFVPIILNALRDSDFRVRRAAAIALGEIREKNEKVLSGLEAALDDLSKETRQGVLWAFLVLNAAPSDSTGVLLKLLHDPDREIRNNAANLLGRIGVPAKGIVPSLVNLLEDPEAEVRGTAADSIGAIGPAATEALQPLVKKLTDPREQDSVREKAANALGNMGAAARISVPFLREAMRSQSQQVSFAAARAITRFVPAAQLIPDLITDLKAPDVSVRKLALRSLTELGPAAGSAVPAIIESLVDPNQDVRSYAASALASMGLQAKVAIPALVESLSGPNPNGGAPEALARIAEEAQDSGVTDLIPALEDAYTALMRAKDLGDKENLVKIDRAIKSLKIRWQRDFALEILAQIRQHPIISGMVFIYLFGLLTVAAIYVFWPLSLPNIDAFLQRHTDFAIKLSVTTLNVPLRYVLLVDFLSKRDRVIDTWVRKYMANASAEFANKTTVRERTNHVPLPVVLQDQTIADFTSADLRTVFAEERTCCLIWGEGGAGKTSLACQIAQWAMANNRNDRLTEHVMLPLLIEDDLDLQVSTGKDVLIEYIRGQLRATLQLQRPIPEELLNTLLRRKRLFVIVDRLSEMSDATRNVLKPAHPEFPINALLVTSRIEEKLDGVPITKLEPLRLETGRLFPFMEAYFSCIGKRSLFDDQEFAAGCQGLSPMIGARNVTVLLAKLYADQMVAMNEKLAGSDLARNIPDLMLDYLNTINRSAKQTALNDREVQLIGKIVAWECLRETYRPIAANREAVIAALGANLQKGDAEKSLDYFERDLRLVNTIGSARDHMRFSLDPLAEYLAGMRVVDLNGTDKQRWQKFFLHTKKVSESPEQIRGFLEAVFDCCLTRLGDDSISSYLKEEFSDRLKRNN